MSKPIVSVIIATFNSGRLLPIVLESVKQQEYPKNKIELLLVDGGSTDDTLSIGRKLRCRIIKNPRTEPVYGKYLGYLKAKGRYIMYLDHDEVIVDGNSIASKIKVLKENPKVKVIAGGNYISPRGYPVINDYINDFGDPFSFFMYRLSKRYRYFLETMRDRYPVLVENKKSVVFDLTNVLELPIIELVAGGSMFDARTLKKEFPKTLKRFELAPQFFYLLYSKYPYIALVKNDPIVHYSSDNLEKYLRKIKWRIKNNILFYKTMGISGYVGREKFQPKLSRLKKYLFIPYALSIIFPLYDSLMLSITRRNIYYFWHFLFCFYTASLIIYYYVVKILKVEKPLKNYDESKIVIMK